MGYETIKYDKGEGFVVITLNRPESLNALNSKMWQELDESLDALMEDDDIRAVIYTGAPRPDGRPCFCAGADLKEMAQGAVDGKVAPAADWTPVSAFWEQRQPRPAMVPSLEKLLWCPKITIVAIDGTCTAGGIELTLCCDIILASETAQISDMHLKNLGWVGGAAANANMAWRIGVPKALELCLTGDVVDGKEAFRIGLANKVFAPDKLLDGAKDMATKIGSMRLSGVVMTKATCRSVEDMGRIASWRYCDAGFAALSNEADAADWGPGRWVSKR